jgi:AcrR family transcriptional regulator
VTAAEPTPRSRREQRKTRTERSLQRAALSLFAERGYDTTTTDEIAEVAGVSSRTFFRYFATKDSVLFVGASAWVRSLTKQFLGKPESMSDVGALREALIDLAPATEPGRDSFALWARATASSLTLRGRVRDHSQDDIRGLSEAIAERRGLGHANRDTRLLAEVTLTTYRRALDRWLATPDEPLAAVIADEFDLLLQQFSPADRNG